MPMFNMLKHVSWINVAFLVLQSALVQTFPIIRNVLPLGQHCCPINESLFWKKTFHAIDATAAKPLSPLLAYRFLLPELQLRGGVSHLGTGVRLRSLVSDLIWGVRPLKVGAVGGSIGWGEGASDRGRTDWFSIFVSWMASVARRGSGGVSGRNGCVPGTTSTYMALCLEQSVDPDVDLVLVEYCLSDGFSDKVLGNSVVLGQERLLRRLLSLPSRPAVVLVLVPHLRSTSFISFPITSEDVEGALAAYYDLPAVSLRNALYPLNVHTATDGFLWNQTFSGSRPGDAGHRALADLLVHLLQETALRLLHYPVSEREMQLRNDRLPTPMYDGNAPPPSLSCLVGADLSALAISAEGWTWSSGGVVTAAASDPLPASSSSSRSSGSGVTVRPRWGYVSTDSGSIMLLRLDTHDSRGSERETVAEGAAAAAVPGGAVVLKTPVSVPILLQYLRSHAPEMGSAEVRCVGGCTCRITTLDGWMGEPSPPPPQLKQLHSAAVVDLAHTAMAHIRTSRVGNATTCDLRISVPEVTRSGGHFFKISGVVVGVGYDMTGAYDHKNWRIPDEA